MSGLLTFGAFRLLRQATQIRLAPLPEWYHSGGPDRIGHTVRLSLDTNRGLLPVCWYEPIIDALHQNDFPACHERQMEAHSCWQSSYLIPTTAPRSPPAIV